MSRGRQRRGDVPKSSTFDDLQSDFFNLFEVKPMTENYLRAILQFKLPYQGSSFQLP